MKTTRILGAIMAFTLAAVPALGIANNAANNKTSTFTQLTAYAASGQWISSAGGAWWYRHYDGSYTKNDWEFIDRDWYFFDGAGWMMRNAWIQTNGKWYYVGGSGAMVTGLQYIGGKYYFFGRDGAMVVNTYFPDTGWIAGPDGAFI